MSVQVEGKGNGIKTVIANMSEIAKALCRPPTCMFAISVFQNFSFALRFYVTELIEYIVYFGFCVCILILTGL